jgi:hypothetical protein
VTEQVISGLDLVQLETMRHQRFQIDPSACDDRHQPSHPFLPAGAQRRDDFQVSESG